LKANCICERKRRCQCDHRHRSGIDRTSRGSQGQRGQEGFLGNLQEKADTAAKNLDDAGFPVSIAMVDVSSRAPVQALVAAAAALGEVVGVIHAAGVSSSQASPETILSVDLYGTALILEEFGHVFARGGSVVVISSQSGDRLGPLSVQQNAALATTVV
jgi:NAD(P)-dependent dehydrogenase (short-subunit alcohol dehydrogenase family)